MAASTSVGVTRHRYCLIVQHDPQVGSGGLETLDEAHDGQAVSYPYLSNGITDLVGVPAAQRLGERSSLDELAWDYILPEDRAAVRDAIEVSAENLAPYDVETRILRPDGVMAWVAQHGEHAP